MNTTDEIRQQIKQCVDRLSPERLQVVADFLAYLSECENNEATEELLAIPSFLAAFERSKHDVAAGKVTDWRKVRKVVNEPLRH